MTSNVQENVTMLHKIATFVCPSLKPLRMYHRTVDKNEIIDATVEMLENLVPSNEPRSRTTTPPSTSETHNSNSKALAMFEIDADDVQDDEDNNEVQTYINQRVNKMEGTLLEWWVSI